MIKGKHLCSTTSGYSFIGSTD